jgi:hypothetical protein
MYCTGTVTVTAETPEEAQAKVDEMINKGALQTSQVEWDDPEYEDSSFATTGDVD